MHYNYVSALENCLKVSVLSRGGYDKNFDQFIIIMKLILDEHANNFIVYTGNYSAAPSLGVWSMAETLWHALMSSYLLRVHVHTIE